VKRIAQLFLMLMLALTALGQPALAGDADPLFVNMTTDDSHRANMGLAFGRNQLERGHPLTIFLNDKGVLIGSKVNAGKFAEHQKILDALLAKGATVLICPMCMKHYGVREGDLVPGIQVGSPDVTGAALFRDNTKSLTW
jgi:sulfur relay (sulfurtransferase) complex TusBCD TusD component (DsrE family)